MRKTLVLIVTISLLFVFTSAYDNDRVDDSVDSFAPNFAVEKIGNIQHLSDFRGVYVLLNFWSSQDAVSRIRNNELDKWTSKNEDKVKLISVNFDESEKLYREVIKQDKLLASNQFHKECDKESRFYRSYHLELGYKSLLIDKQGKVVLINPTQDELTRILCQ